MCTINAAIRATILTAIYATNISANISTIHATFWSANDDSISTTFYETNLPAIWPSDDATI